MIALYALLLMAAPASVTLEGEDEALVERVRAACAEIDAALVADRGPARPYVVQVVQAPSTDAFVAATLRARFEAAALTGRTIWLQPARVLDRLPRVEAILRHECVHATLRARGIPALDPVDEEVVALVLSGQAAAVAPAPPLAPNERAAASEILAHPTDRAAFERTLARALATSGDRVRALLRDGKLLDVLRARRSLLP